MIQIQIGPPYTAISENKESEYDLVENYPRAASWGVLGWTFKTRDDAEKKMGELIKTRKLCRKPGKLGIHQ